MNTDNLSKHEKKILLLRTLGVPEALIQKVADGSEELSAALAQRISTVMSDSDDSTQCAIICQNIRRAGVSYDTLDPDEYLNHIAELRAKGGSFSEASPSYMDPQYRALGVRAASNYSPTHDFAEDFSAARDMSSDSRSPYTFGDSAIFQTTSEEAKADSESLNNSASILPKPFVRLLTKLVDLMISMFIVNIFARALFGKNPSLLMLDSIGFTFAIYALMLALEPLWLHFFGTTPGKAVFGIRIYSADGSKLSFSAAYKRSLIMAFYGFGFMLPIYRFYTVFRSLGQCRRGMVLPWDLGCKLKSSDNAAGLRIGLALLAIFVVSGTDAFISFSAEMPDNKAPLTVQQYNENCEQLIRYNSLTIDHSAVFEPTISRDGKVTGVTFTIEATAPANIFGFYDEMYLAFMSVAAASEKADVISTNMALLKLKDPLAEFSFNFLDYTITNHITAEGYVKNVMSGYLYSTAETGRRFKQTFSVTRKDAYD